MRPSASAYALALGRLDVVEGGEFAGSPDRVFTLADGGGNPALVTLNEPGDA
jgi:hypothetical protein